MEEANPDFIQPSEHSPNLSSNIEVKEIPVIDLSCSRDEVIGEIKEACKKWGFFQVVNHGVPWEKRETVELAARKFFALSSEEKNRVKRDEGNPLGYYDSEHTKNVRDWKQIFDYTVLDPTLVPATPDVADSNITELRNQWPTYPPHFREACEAYSEEMVKLSFKLLELIALSLDVPADSVSGFFKDHTSFVRINYYPPCPFPDMALGVGPHKDSSALTVLAQDGVAGLEVKRKSDGAWILVKPVPDAYIINVGDVIQYESVEHRVKVNPTKDRLSIPFFFNPSHYVEVKPLNKLIDQQNPEKYSGYNFGKFYTTRRLSDFKKLNVDNIQICNFRLVE
ncbi:hypothetical protein RDABS01_019905 [Bienertia sinuspersici]